MRLIQMLHTRQLRIINCYYIAMHETQLEAMANYIDCHKVPKDNSDIKNV